MTHPYTKLADALESYAPDGDGYNTEYAHNLLEAASILRAAASVDVAGLMREVRRFHAVLSDWNRAGNKDTERPITEADVNAAEAALESALRMALAGREGFVLAPREGVEQIADALADVLATFQHAEPEALKAAIQHSNRSAHAAYTLVYGLLAAAPKGTP